MCVWQAMPCLFPLCSTSSRPWTKCEYNINVTSAVRQRFEQLRIAASLIFAAYNFGRLHRPSEPPSKTLVEQPPLSRHSPPPRLSILNLCSSSVPIHLPAYFMLRSVQLAKDAQEKLAALPASAADVDGAVTAANALLLQAAVSPPADLARNSDPMILALAAVRDRALLMERAMSEASAKVVAYVATATATTNHTIVVFFGMLLIIL